jgi:hypothetical protein
MEHFGEHDAAVRLLIIFNKRDKNARRRDGSTIERVCIAQFSLGVLVADIETSALKIMEV